VWFIPCATKIVGVPNILIFGFRCVQNLEKLIFNEQEGKPIPFVYGCAVTSGEWKFLRLEKGNVSIDTKTYYLVELPKILGVFHQVIKSFLE